MSATSSPINLNASVHVDHHPVNPFCHCHTFWNSPCAKMSWHFSNSIQLPLFFFFYFPLFQVYIRNTFLLFFFSSKLLKLHFPGNGNSPPFPNWGTNENKLNNNFKNKETFNFRRGDVNWEQLSRIYTRKLNKWLLFFLFWNSRNEIESRENRSSTTKDVWGDQKP